MSWTGTALVYLLVGLAVGIASFLRERRAFLMVIAIPFWPLLFPFLLGARSARSGGDTRITKVQGEVLQALARLDGLAEEALAPEIARVRDLASAMEAMSRRIEKMDELLQSPQLAQHAADEQLRGLSARGVPEDDARVQSVRARLKNIERLKALRDRTRADLERILLKLEEMAAQLQVLQFAGRPEAELLSSIKEIADGVEAIAGGLFAEDLAVDMH